MPTSFCGSSRVRFASVLTLTAALLWSPDASRGAVPKRRRPQVEYSPIQPGMGGVSVYAPGKWGILNLHVRNPVETPQELLSTTYFEGQPTLQYGRRLWLPARSRLFTWQPVLIPGRSSEEN